MLVLIIFLSYLLCIFLLILPFFLDNKTGTVIFIIGGIGLVLTHVSNSILFDTKTKIKTEMYKPTKISRFNTKIILEHKDYLTESEQIKHFLIPDSNLCIIKETTINGYKADTNYVYSIDECNK